MLEHTAGDAENLSVAPRFGLEGVAIPWHAMPAGEVAPGSGYQIVRDELMLDGNARLRTSTLRAQVRPGRPGRRLDHPA
jgi:hypothetical protein